MGKKITETFLYKLAKKAHKNAYAPYSHFHVGASLELSNGKTYFGCNIENASYGGTICAERVAIVKAFSENSKKIKIKKIIIFTKTHAPCPPCGFCLQVVSEFADEHTEIYLSNESGIQKKYLFIDLMPFSFQSKMLLKRNKT